MVKSDFKNMTTALFLVCLFCSSLLAAVYVLSTNKIQEAKLRKQEEALKEVLPFSEGDKLIKKYISIKGEEDKHELYVLERNTKVLAYSIKAEASGFGGKLVVLTGILKDGTIYNTKVLEHSETPGLGAKCSESSSNFVKQFRKIRPLCHLSELSSKSKNKLSDADDELVFVPLSLKEDGGELDAITASTITSKAYIAAVNRAFEIFKRFSDSESESMAALEED